MSIAEERDTVQEHRVSGEEHLESFTSQKRSRYDEDGELVAVQKKQKVGDQEERELNHKLNRALDVVPGTLSMLLL